MNICPAPLVSALVVALLGGPSSARAETADLALEWCKRWVRPSGPREPRIDQSRQHQVDGVLAEQGRDYQKAIEHYRQGYQDNYCKPEFLVLAGDAYRKWGKPTESLAAYEEYQRERERYDEAIRQEPPALARLKPREREAAQRQHERAKESARAGRQLVEAELLRAYSELDRLTTEARGRDGAKAELLLVQARTRLYLRRWAEALDFLEQYQRSDPKSADPRVRASYEVLQRELGQALEGARAQPRVMPPPELLLLGRVAMGLYQQQRQIGEIQNEAYLETAVQHFSDYREPAPAFGPVNPEFSKGLPPVNIKERQHYLGAIHLLRAACEQDKSRVVLRGYLGRSLHLAGEPKLALQELRASEAAWPEARRPIIQHWIAQAINVEPPKQERCPRLCRVLVGVGAGLVAASAGVGLGLGLGLRPQPETMPVPRPNTLGGLR